MVEKYAPPAIDKTAFNCPHCGALAKQHWFSVHASRLDKDSTPYVIDAEHLKTIKFDEIEDPAERDIFKKWAKRMVLGRPFLEPNQKYRSYDLPNVSVSECYNCNDIAIWIYEHLIWPARSEAPTANSDLPPDVRTDYDEAGTILALSPRGAAALLRLAIQKLCKHLGEKGENINEDIKKLVKKGLDARIQQALDVVRVIGNSAVHPGQIDLKDDRATAARLFGLVNIIADTMISQPNHIKAMYDGLPSDALQAIERRDKQNPP